MFAAFFYWRVRDKHNPKSRIDPLKAYGPNWQFNDAHWESESETFANEGKFLYEKRRGQVGLTQNTFCVKKLNFVNI